MFSSESICFRNKPLIWILWEPKFLSVENIYSYCLAGINLLGHQPLWQRFPSTSLGKHLAANLSTALQLTRFLPGRPRATNSCQSGCRLGSKPSACARTGSLWDFLGIYSWAWWPVGWMWFPGAEDISFSYSEDGRRHGTQSESHSVVFDSLRPHSMEFSRPEYWTA